jgi:uncharacterized damage-inducible protein DinB
VSSQVDGDGDGFGGEWEGTGMLTVMLDAWERNNRILKNLLRAVPEAGMETRVAEGTKSVREMFLHIHGTRVFFLSEDAPEFARPLPEGWRKTRDREQISTMLDESARAIGDAVKHYVETGQALRVRFDHPLLFLVHLIWHEGYHHGQIKLALKAAGLGLDDESIGAVTWHVFMDKGARD